MTVALGHSPIRGDSGYWTLLQCVRDEEPPSLPEDSHWSPEFRDLLYQCLQKDPKIRATCEDLLEVCQRVACPCAICLRCARSLEQRPGFGCVLSHPPKLVTYLASHACICSAVRLHGARRGIHVCSTHFWLRRGSTASEMRRRNARPRTCFETGPYRSCGICWTRPGTTLNAFSRTTGALRMERRCRTTDSFLHTWSTWRRLWPTYSEEVLCRPSTFATDPSYGPYFECADSTPLVSSSRHERFQRFPLRATPRSTR